MSSTWQQHSGLSSCIFPYGHQWNRDRLFLSLFSLLISPPTTMVNIENPQITKDSDFVIISIFIFCLYSFYGFDVIALFVNVFVGQIMAEDRWKSIFTPNRSVIHEYAPRPIGGQHGDSRIYRDQQTPAKWVGTASRAHLKWTEHCTASTLSIDQHPDHYHLDKYGPLLCDQSLNGLDYNRSLYADHFVAVEPQCHYGRTPKRQSTAAVTSCAPSKRICAQIWIRWFSGDTLSRSKWHRSPRRTEGDDIVAMDWDHFDFCPFTAVSRDCIFERGPLRLFRASDWNRGDEQWKGSNRRVCNELNHQNIGAHFEIVVEEKWTESQSGTPSMSGKV